MSKVILYDLPSKPPCHSWSLNPMKTRMILNFKGIDYKTEWIEYPDLAPTFKSFGIPPNDPNSVGYFADYSSPALRYEDGTYGMDSWPMAHELEKRYPTPSLHLDDPIVVKIRDHVGKIMGPLIPHLIPKVPRVLLNKPSADFFYATREKMFGMTVDEYEKGHANEKCWENVVQPANEAADLLKKSGGLFFLGSTVSYADFIFVSMLFFMKRIDEGIFDRFLSLDPAFGKVYDASKQWMEKLD